MSVEFWRRDPEREGPGYGTTLYSIILYRRGRGGGNLNTINGLAVIGLID